MQPDVDIVPAPTQDPIDAFGVGRGQADRLAELGHELKTPINGILGILSLLRATTLDPEQREMVDLMWDSAEAQSKLVARLNHSVVADAGTGADQAQDTRFVPRRVLESVVGLMRPAADEKGLALLLVVDPSADAPLRGRVDALRQILLNLVGNAVKFTAAGEIRVTASCPPPPDQAGDHGRRRSLDVAVRDTGPGIPPRHRGHVFERFARGASNAEGSGMGLHISKELIDAMGGVITLQEAHPQGCEFRIRVPLAVAGDEAAATGRAGA